MTPRDTCADQTVDQKTEKKDDFLLYNILCVPIYYISIGGCIIHIYIYTKLIYYYLYYRIYIIQGESLSILTPMFSLNNKFIQILIVGIFKDRIFKYYYIIII